ncbi:hypothetical protein CSUB01_01434 [Colletotrichum sublineola]|uniref:Uncharacterized protein n=1 Tax=Colletotrichum sublineola TaxID=1173701 RepID=A0A066X1Q8_COLSU|nr:hypothetical protein CSUB01_01434 [Colletotrichum sublineola]
MFVTPTAPPAAAPPAAACPPAVTPAASSAPAATSKPGLVIPGTPQPPPFAGLLSSSSIPPPPAATPAPVAAEPPSSRSAALPQVGGPAGNSNPTKSLNLGGLTSAAAAQPVSEATPPVAANPAQPQIDVSGLALSKSLQLGNLLQQTAKLQARETARL